MGYIACRVCGRSQETPKGPDPVTRWTCCYCGAKHTVKEDPPPDFRPPLYRVGDFVIKELTEIVCPAESLPPESPPTPSEDTARINWLQHTRAHLTLEEEGTVFRVSLGSAFFRGRTPRDAIDKARKHFPMPEL